jgi:Mn-dependent DtxR family transcriptional regulator
MSDCDCVKVTPDRLKIIIGLGCIEGGVATAEKLENMIEVPIDRVLEALDGLLTAGVVDDVDAEEFLLTEEGSGLFHAVYDATGAVLGKG